MEAHAHAQELEQGPELRLAYDRDAVAHEGHDPIDGTPLSQETPWQRAIGFIASGTAIAVTAGTVPQVLSVWGGDTSGVSLLTWSFMLVNVVAWLLYGIAHRRVALIAANIPGVLSVGAVVVGLVVRG